MKKQKLITNNFTNMPGQIENSVVIIVVKCAFYELKANIYFKKKKNVWRRNTEISLFIKEIIPGKCF